jgi:hypothetical protein
LSVTWHIRHRRCGRAGVTGHVHRDAFFGLARAYYDFDNDPAFGKLNEQFGGLFHTRDLIEGPQRRCRRTSPGCQGT